MSKQRLKSTPLADEAAFIRTVNGIAALQASAARIIAERDAAIVAIQNRYHEQLEPLDNVIDAKLALADAYAEEHRAELLPKDKKSVELASAAYGWRTGNRTVKPATKKDTPESIIARLKAAGLSRYVRIVEEIAKEKILSDCKDDKHLPAGEGILVAFALDLFGLKIAQSETFYIEPKAESGATLKPEARA